jgi:isopenicillin N synthase-like dioxygenase
MLGSSVSSRLLAADTVGALTATLVFVAWWQSRSDWSAGGRRIIQMKAAQLLRRTAAWLWPQLAASDRALDARSDRFATQACIQLHERGFAIIRLEPEDAQLAQLLFDAATTFFDDTAAKRGAQVPPLERQAHDARSGYVCEMGREFFELHPRAGGGPYASPSVSAVNILQASTEFATSCHSLCERVLLELASSSEAVALLIRLEGLARAGNKDRPHIANVDAVDSRPGAASGSFSASMLRVHRYTDDADYPPHADLGLLTIAPRASIPGLMVQAASGEWETVEEGMAANEAILFGGSTLTALMGIPALQHKVKRQGHTRLSAPYFLRASPDVTLPQPAAHTVSPRNEDPSEEEERSVRAFISRKVAERRQQRIQTSANAPTLAAAGAAVTAAASPVASTPLSSGPTLAPAAVGEVAVASVGQVAVATPVAVGAPVAGGSAFAARIAPPARVKYVFHKIDADHDGRVTLPELRAGLEAEFGDQLPRHARVAIDACFETSAVGDLSFAERYVDGRLFNAVFAEVLFKRFDAHDTGFLTHGQAQDALKFLVRSPADGGPKPGITFAYPADVCTDAGELRLPPSWFATIYRNMP